MKNEPILITSFFSALLGVLISFGINITEQQSNAMLEFIKVSAPVILPLIPIVARWFTYSINSVKKITGNKNEDSLKILESKKGMSA